MDKVRYAIVGCGSVSANRYFPNLGALSRGQLVAVCDSVKERVKPRAEEFGVPYYTDFDEMLAKEGFDLLVNITGAPAHFPLNLKALQADRHVYTQKPMTVTTEEASILIEEAAARGLKLVAEEAGHIFPDKLAIRRMLQEGVIGKVVWARSRCTHVGSASQDAWPTDPVWKYQYGSGPLREVGIERLHLLTALLGPAKRVTAMSGINQPEVVVRGGPMKGTVIQVEEDDITLLTIDFGDAIFALLDTAWVQIRGIKTPDLEIYGSKGVITSMGGGPKGRELNTWLYRDEPELGIRGWTEVEVIPSDKPQPPVQVLGMAHAIDCILDDKEPVLSGEHARHCIEIIDKAYIAARTGVTQELETTF
jgi:predicted dehydrogenase